jgi:hypothetical protein
VAKPENFMKIKNTKQKRRSALAPAIGSALGAKVDAYMRLNEFMDRLKGELIDAIQKHKPMHSPHEGHSVIREEVEELWEHVKADTGHSDAAIKEAMQIAAMGIRYAVDMSAP